MESDSYIKFCARAYNDINFRKREGDILKAEFDV
jgi:hypothetical protein